MPHGSALHAIRQRWHSHHSLRYEEQMQHGNLPTRVHQETDLNGDVIGWRKALKVINWSINTHKNCSLNLIHVEHGNDKLRAHRHKCTILACSCIEWWHTLSNININKLWLLCARLTMADCIHIQANLLYTILLNIQAEVVLFLVPN